MNLDCQYQEKWKSYKKKETIYKISKAVYIFLFLVGTYFSQHIFDVIFNFFLLFVSFQAIEIYMKDLSCPKCQKKFFRKTSLSKFIVYNLNRKLKEMETKNCVHCNLRIYQGSTYFLKSR